LSYFALEEVG